MQEIKQLKSIENWLENEVSKMYRNEVTLKTQVAEWVKKAGHPKIKVLLQHYFDMIKRHELTLEEEIGEVQISLPGRKASMALEAMIKEIGENMLSSADYNLSDVCMISGIQAINHYKISTYGTMATIAEMLGKTKLQFKIRELENNEKITDLQLTEVAVHGINQDALLSIGR